MNLPSELWQLIIEYNIYDLCKKCILINKNNYIAVVNIINKIPDQMEIKLELSNQVYFICDYCEYGYSCKCIYEEGIPFSESKWTKMHKIKINQKSHDVPNKSNISQGIYIISHELIKKIKMIITKNDILLSKHIWHHISYSKNGIFINVKELFVNYKQIYDTIVIAFDFTRNFFVYYKK